MHGHGETVHIPFPFDEEDLKTGELFYVDKAVKITKKLTFYRI